jgi:hypothetical protein
MSIHRLIATAGVSMKRVARLFSMRAIPRTVRCGANRCCSGKEEGYDHNAVAHGASCKERWRANGRLGIHRILRLQQQDAGRYSRRFWGNYHVQHRRSQIGVPISKYLSGGFIERSGASTLWQLTANKADAVNRAGQAPQLAIKESFIGSAPATITVAPISVNLYQFPVAQ